MSLGDFMNDSCMTSHLPSPPVADLKPHRDPLGCLSQNIRAISLTDCPQRSEALGLMRSRIPLVSSRHTFSLNPAGSRPSQASCYAHCLFKKSNANCDPRHPAAALYRPPGHGRLEHVWHRQK